MSAAVEWRAVRRRFGTVTAVDEVSLVVQAGEFLTLLGPSGCGKTTLLRLAAGFETPEAGTIWLGGADVTHEPPFRRDVNQVFQSYALFPHLTVRDNIAFGLRRQGLPGAAVTARVREAVELVALQGCEARWPHELSGGQRQRVALARALAPRPAVLLLDEPLSALDARLRRTMQEELKRLQRQVGTTFVFVTHDQDEAMVLSDRIAVLQAGRLVQVGTGPELYRRPATAFVAEFLGLTNLLPAVRAGEGWRIDAAVTLASAAAGAAAPAWISVRPERVALAPAPPPGPNGFRVRVEETVFRGALEQLTVVTDGGTRLLVLRAGGCPAQPGQLFWAGVPPEEVVTVGA